MSSVLPKKLLFPRTSLGLSFIPSSPSRNQPLGVLIGYHFFTPALDEKQEIVVLNQSHLRRNARMLIV